MRRLFNFDFPNDNLYLLKHILRKMVNQIVVPNILTVIFLSKFEQIFSKLFYFKVEIPKID